MGALVFLFFFVLIAFYVIFVRQINQYQRGVKFRFGTYAGIMNPGWRVIIPILESYQKVDMRVRAVDVPSQEAMTKDNISVTINAVIYYKIVAAEKAVLEVEYFAYAISQLAQTTMRNVVGEVTLDELLSQREQVSAKIEGIVDKLTDPWGIKVDQVNLKDVVLPEDMKRVMAKQAEAERERRAVIIKAEGEVVAANNMSKAAATLASSEGALHLRTLQTINDVSSDQSNTLVFMIPLEVLRAFEKVGIKKTG